MLPTVEFCGLTVTRLVIGANPFGGFSHQSPERDQEMRSYYTVPRIKETWRRAEAAGINTMVTNNETPHVVQAVREYLAEGGPLQWVMQFNPFAMRNVKGFIEEAVGMGCKAAYLHGGAAEELYLKRDAATLRNWCATVKAFGLPAGVAGHAPEVHQWVDSLGAADFHAVCFFNCGSLHAGKGHKFSLNDMLRAVETLRALPRPCIAYKVMGAGRIEPRMALEYAFSQIKPGDIVNVGMYRGDKDNMVEENAAIAREILGAGA